MNEAKEVNHRAAWTAKSLQAQSADWIYRLTTDDLAELDQALHGVRSRGLVVPNFDQHDFPIPKLMAKLATRHEGLNFGLGILYIRGFPVERYTKDQASAIFWGLGMHIGKPWEQNMRGHVLGDVIDEGKSLSDTSARGYQSTAGLEMHTDGADIVGLLCLKQAPTGGENQIVSGISVFNKLTQHHPGVARHLLNKTFGFDWRNEEAPGTKPYYLGQVYEPLGEGVSSFALIGYIHSAQRHAEVPRLTDVDIQALDTFQAMTQDPELVFSFRQSAGDMVFLNNHFHLHARTSFTDSPDPRERRHLRRLWLEAPEWAAQRPKVMAQILSNARAYWQKHDAIVPMWDHL